MSKRVQYQAKESIQTLAANAKGWEGISQLVINRLQENCELLGRKKITKTKLVGFSINVTKDGKHWNGNMSLRYNNNFLDKNPIRYNFSNVFTHARNDWYDYYRYTNAYNKHRSWKDLNCNSRNIGINGIRASIVDKIIEINRQNSIKIAPSVVSNNLYNWKTVENEVLDRKSTRLNSSHTDISRMPSSA